jgi:hypothetical protein
MAAEVAAAAGVRSQRACTCVCAAAHTGRGTSSSSWQQSCSPLSAYVELHPLHRHSTLTLSQLATVSTATRVVSTCTPAVSTCVKLTVLHKLLHECCARGWGGHAGCGGGAGRLARCRGGRLGWLSSPAGTEVSSTGKERGVRVCQFGGSSAAGGVCLSLLRHVCLRRLKLPLTGEVQQASCCLACMRVGGAQTSAGPGRYK